MENFTFILRTKRTMEENKVEREKGREEELVKAVKVLAGTAFVPLKVAVDLVGGLAGSLEEYLPKPSPSRLASDLIGVRITALKKEVELLERYKEELKAKGEEEGAGKGKKEKVKVE